MTFSESSGQVPGANVPLIFSLETVNIEKFGPEVTIHCPTSSFKKSGKMDFLAGLTFYLLHRGAYIKMSL